MPNKISIEGHTDSQPFSGGANYTNWELSADRANASRRLMQQHGLRADQVAQVRGFADQQPRDEADPIRSVQPENHTDRAVCGTEATATLDLAKVRPAQGARSGARRSR